jgi:hypothetical protein
MEATRNPDGTINAPFRAKGDDGTIGDGMSRIGPDDPAYAAWDEWLKDGEQG